MPLICLTACGVPKFPADHVYEVDLVTRVCGQYKIVDHERMLFEFEKELTPEECPIVFGFKTGDVPYVMDWVRDRIKGEGRP